MGFVLDDITGRKFGRLTVTCLDRMSRSATFWRCKCDCGNEVSVRGSSLKNGETKSCGCLRKELTQKAMTTHGMSHSRLYHIWNSMILRCEYPSSNSYARYGGSGISVCDEWHSFEKFRDWAYANGYTEYLTIDRKNNTGNYEPSNCRWVTNRDQCNNRRSNHICQFRGENMTISEIATLTGLPYKALYGRIYRGSSAEQAVKLMMERFGIEIQEIDE